MTRKARIAVLMTCHNRREKTLGCLRSLHQQQQGDPFQIDVFVVDAGSSDGTREAVKREFPRVKLMLRDDSIFWCGGMRIAWKAALEGSYEYYMWLNDDVVLDQHAVMTLLHTSQTVRESSGQPAIIAGSTRDPETGCTTYGGVVVGKGIHRMSFELVEPAETPLPCSTTHGNCVLIPSPIAEKIGILSDKFTHGLGDLDYGLRALSKGLSCWIAPGHVGNCARNSPQGSHFDPALPLWERVRKMNETTGLPPAREWRCFTRRHAGIMWPLFWARTFVRVCMPVVWVLLRQRPQAKTEVQAVAQDSTGSASCG